MKKVVVVLLIALFSTSCGSATQSLSETSMKTISSTTVSSTTTSTTTTTVSPVTTVPPYTGPLYPQLFIDASDEESCSEISGIWDYGPPSWGQYCRPSPFSLMSDSELCSLLESAWNEEQQRCYISHSAIQTARQLEDESLCIERGGIWTRTRFGYVGCDFDKGTIWTAYFEDICLERGGTWNTSEEPNSIPERYFCYEDDGSLWDARHQTTCMERGGTWDLEKTHRRPEEGPGRWGRCFIDLGEVRFATDELDCRARGGIWKTDPNDYSWTQACLAYETEHKLADLFDPESDWKNVLFRNCANPDEILSQLSGFMIGEPWLDLFWEKDNLSCEPWAPEIEEHFHSPSHTFELPVVNPEGGETLFYVMSVAWVGLLEVLDIEGPGFANFARIHDESSKGEVLFSGCAPCLSPNTKEFQDVFIMSSDGTNRRRVLGSCYRYCRPTSFSPDGESFLHYDIYNGSISTRLYQIDLEGNLIRALDPETDSRTIIENVSVSPSRTHIAYWMTPDPALRPNLFVTDFEGSPIQQLTDFDPMDFHSFSIFGENSIAWSLDETQIGFCFHREPVDWFYISQLGKNCKKHFAVSTRASSTNEFEEISLETYELWINQQE